MKNKKTIVISIIGLLIIISLVCGGIFLVKRTNDKKIRAEYNSYVSKINYEHNFKDGLDGLVSLDNNSNNIDNLKNKIQIVEQLKTINNDLENKKIDEAKNLLEKVNKLKDDDTFDIAISWLKNDVDNYERAIKEINGISTNEGLTNFKKDIYKIENKNLIIILDEKIKEKTEIIDKKEKEQQEQKITEQNSSANLHGWSNYEFPRSGLPFYELKNVPNYAMTPRIVRYQQAPITFGELRDGASEATSYLKNTVEVALGRPLSSFQGNKELGQAIIEATYTGAL